MAFKFVLLFALISLSAAAPQHYQSYYNHQNEMDQPSSQILIKKISSPVPSSVVYKKYDESHNPTEYQFTYAMNDDHSSKNIKNMDESKTNDMTSASGHYDMNDFKGYNQYVNNYENDNKMNSFDGIKDNNFEQKYYIPTSNYKNDDYNKKYIESSAIVYHEKPSTAIVYQNEPTDHHHQHQQHHHQSSNGNSNYDTNSYTQMKHHHHLPTSYEYSGDISSSSENHSPSSAIYYQQDVPSSHSTDNTQHDTNEPKYIFVKSEKSDVPSAETSMINHFDHETNLNHDDKPIKTIKYSSAHTSSHVSFNGPNASYHY